MLGSYNFVTLYPSVKFNFHTSGHTNGDRLLHVSRYNFRDYGSFLRKLC